MHHWHQSVRYHLCMCWQRCRKEKEESFPSTGDEANKCRRENTMLVPLLIYFDQSCPTSCIMHLFLIPIRTGNCFRRTLSSYAQKRIARFTLPDFLSVPDPLKLYKSKVTPVSVQLCSTLSGKLCIKLANFVLFRSQVGIKIVLPQIQSSLCTSS